MPTKHGKLTFLNKQWKWEIDTFDICAHSTDKYPRHPEDFIFTGNVTEQSFILSLPLISDDVSKHADILGIIRHLARMGSFLSGILAMTFFSKGNLPVAIFAAAMTAVLALFNILSKEKTLAWNSLSGSLVSKRFDLMLNRKSAEEVRKLSNAKLDNIQNKRHSTL